MRVYDCGVYRDATPEEVAAWERTAGQLSLEPTPEERIAALEEELRATKALLGLES